MPEELRSIGDITANARQTGESRILNAQTAEGVVLRPDQQHLIDGGGSVIVDTAGNAISYKGA